MSAAHLCRKDMYWVLTYWKAVMKNKYQKLISLVASKINRKLNGWLHPVQLVRWSNLPVELQYCNNKWHMLYWKSRTVLEKGEKKLYVLCSFCQHFVFIPGFCSARPETLGVREVGSPLFLGVLMPVTALVLYSLRGDLENAAVTSMEGEGSACHILILQTLRAGRYNKALISPRKMLLRMHKKKV